MLRLVSRQVATLQELETHYDIDDVADMNEVLDLMDEAERLAIRDAEKG